MAIQSTICSRATDHGGARGPCAAQVRPIEEVEDTADVALSLGIRRDPAIAGHRLCSSVVRGQSESEVVPILADQVPAMPHTAVDVLALGENVAYAQLRRGGGQALHETE